MSTRYKKHAGGVFDVKYHFVWCPKYRRKVLTGKIAERLREVLSSKARELGLEIEALEIQPDYVHLFITGEPTDAIQHVINQLKGHSSHVLRNEFPELRSKLPTLWSRSYYVGTIGHVSEEAVEKYIEAQKGK